MAAAALRIALKLNKLTGLTQIEQKWKIGLKKLLIHVFNPLSPPYQGDF